MSKKSKSQKLAELISLSMKVQEETTYCVFIHFSGHVDKIKIDVCKSKNDYLDIVITGEFYTHERYDEGHFDKRYLEVKSVLVSILENGEVDFNHENIKEIERVEYDYKF